MKTHYWSHPLYQLLRVVHALGFKKTFWRLVDKHYPVVYEGQEFSHMLDVRVTEIATGKVSNWFDMTTAEITAIAKALHPQLFTIETWHPLLSDGPVHPDEFKGSVYLGDGWPAEASDSDEFPGCLACSDSERYDDHMHGSC